MHVLERSARGLWSLGEQTNCQPQLLRPVQSLASSRLPCRTAPNEGTTKYARRFSVRSQRRVSREVEQGPYRSPHTSAAWK